MPRVVLVLPTSTYRAQDFIDAARSLGADVVVASEIEQAMSQTMGDRFVRIDLCDPEGSGQTIAERVPGAEAVVGVDEQGVEIAAHAAQRLGLAHNPPEAVALTRDKARMREVLSSAGLHQPKVDPDGFPVVVKATSLSASRGVIRANDPDELAAALDRVRAIAGDEPLLVEEYIPGDEVAAEGLLRDSTLEVLAIFDKPDPLVGPHFEETIYVTPSRLSSERQAEIGAIVQRACAAMGLIEGPIHAEVRLPAGRCVVLEVAARSIGGLCSRTLRFGASISLEEVILRHALGLDPGDLHRVGGASGVMMIPIPASGTLRSVDGIAAARDVEGIRGIEITVPAGQRVQALPEGDRYLGFIFAAGTEPSAVEEALRAAHSALRIEID